MRKFIDALFENTESLIFVLWAVICISIAAYTPNYKRNDSVLQENVRVVPFSPGYRLIGFVDEETGLYGFLTNGSKLTVKVEPQYEDMYTNGHLLVGVKKNGLWGIMDLGLRFKRAQTLEEPLMPFKYKRIEILNDYEVVCDGRKYDMRKIYEMW